MSGRKGSGPGLSKGKSVAFLGCFVALTLAASSSTVWSGDFSINVWWPAGHSASDTSFTSNDVAHLADLGVNMILATPRLDFDSYPEHIQDFEAHIMATLPDTIGFIVYWQPNGMYTTSYLETFAEQTTPLNTNQKLAVAECVDRLVSKWGSAPYSGSFRGYQIYHEYPYSSSCSYSNVSAVVDSIRAEDTTRWILAVGNANCTWSPSVDIFLDSLFEPASLGYPANIFQQDRYVFGTNIDSTDEDDVRAALNTLVADYDAMSSKIDHQVRDEENSAVWHAVIQAGEYGNYRRMTEAESRAGVFLALSRGAEGISYFLYSTRDDDVYKGLVDVPVSGVRAKLQPYFDHVKDLNAILKKIGPTVADLTWEAAFPSTGAGSSGTYVTACTGSDIELGVFDPYGGDDYFIVVNRKCLSANTVDVTLDTDSLQHSGTTFRLTDLYSGDKWVAKKSGTTVKFEGITPDKGYGRVFRVEASSIQSAINAASSGQTVWVSPGTYGETLSMKSGVDLRKSGTGTVSIDPGPSVGYPPATFYNDTNVTVDGIKFKNMAGGGAIEVWYDGTGVVLDGVEAEAATTSGYYGVYLRSTSVDEAPDVRNDSEIHTCNRGLYFYNAPGYIDSTHVHDNIYGAYYYYMATANLDGHNYFHANSTYDVYASSNCWNIDAENNWWGAGGPDVYHADQTKTTDCDPEASGDPPWSKLAVTASQPGDQAWDRYASAKERKDSGDLNGALADLKGIVSSYPDAEAAFFALREVGWVYGGLGQRAEGVSYLEGVARQHPGEEIGAAALFFTIPFLVGFGDYPVVLDRCDEIPRRFPSSDLRVSALIDKAGAYLYGLGDEANAREVFAEIVAKYPESEEAECARAKLAVQQPASPPVAKQAGTPDLAIFPNPCNPLTTIQFSLPSTAKVSLAIYNALGQQVAVLVDEMREAGTHSVVWDGRDSHGMALGSGLCFARLQAGGSAQTQRMLLLK